MWTSIYPLETLLELQSYVDEARQRVGDDERAQGWIRVAQISYDQYALIAKMFHERMKFRGEGPKSKDLFAQERRNLLRVGGRGLETRRDGPRLPKELLPRLRKAWCDLERR